MIRGKVNSTLRVTAMKEKKVEYPCGYSEEDLKARLCYLLRHSGWPGTGEPKDYISSDRKTKGFIS